MFCIKLLCLLLIFALSLAKVPNLRHTKFLLYTRSNPKDPKVPKKFYIRPKFIHICFHVETLPCNDKGCKDKNLKDLGFNSSQHTMFLIHGWNSGGKSFAKKFLKGLS